MTRRGDPAIAVGYVRVSTDEQLLGPEAQREAIAAWAAGRGVVVAEWYEDRVSGATPVDLRRGLLAALDAVQRLRAGVLVAHRRDRLARDVVVAAQVERLAARSGAAVLTADNVAAGEGPEADLLRRLLDAFAEHERALIKLRTRSALAVRRRRSERFSGGAPLGVRFVGELPRRPGDPPTRLEADAGEEAVMAKIHRLRQQGLSIRAITRVLNAAGDRPRGRAWHRNTVARVLARADRKDT